MEKEIVVRKKKGTAHELLLAIRKRMVFPGNILTFIEHTEDKGSQKKTSTDILEKDEISNAQREGVRNIHVLRTTNTGMFSHGLKAHDIL